MNPSSLPITAAYGEKVDFYYSDPDTYGPRYDVWIKYPDFNIRLIKYSSVDHANVEMEEFKFEVTRGSDTLFIEYCFDHWSDTWYRSMHPELYSIGGISFKLWHYASREGLKFNEFIITKE